MVHGRKIKGGPNMKNIPMRDFKNTAEAERHKEEQGPIFVTKNGYGD